MDRRGRKKRRASQDERVMRAFQEAARLKPESAPAHEQLGVAWFTKGDFGKAAKAFRQVLRVKKGDAGAYYNLGMALIKKGDPAGAAEALRQAVKLKPKNSRAKLFLSEILLDTASKDIAAKEQATGIVGLGMMNLNKDLTEALTLGEQVVEEEPDNEEAHLVLAEAYAQKVDNGHAEEHYTAVRAARGRSRARGARSRRAGGGSRGHRARIGRPERPEPALVPATLVGSAARAYVTGMTPVVSFTIVYLVLFVDIPALTFALCTIQQHLNGYRRDSTA